MQHIILLLPANTAVEATRGPAVATANITPPPTSRSLWEEETAVVAFTKITIAAAVAKMEVQPDLELGIFGSFVRIGYSAGLFVYRLDLWLR
jgi:hypothetical protein